jgi:alkyl sulfatase BDS1-like metallo-beta-lactamase superfamily hydrolase
MQLPLWTLRVASVSTVSEKQSLRVACRCVAGHSQVRFLRSIEGASPLEKLHVAALDALVYGRYREAAAVYETILMSDPTDLLAQRCAFDIYVMLGYGSDSLTLSSAGN